jgi:hypothetical protein
MKVNYDRITIKHTDLEISTKFKEGSITSIKILCLNSKTNQNLGLENRKSK